MDKTSLRRLSILSAGLFTLVFNFLVPSSKAASALAAWALTREGVLELRTSINAQLKAFYQSSEKNTGLRVWIDFPGELKRPRKIAGNGPVREIRLGKPVKGITRLVIEFQPQISLDPNNLKLIGTSPDRWKLNLSGLPTKNLRSIGEGDLTAFSSKDWSKNLSINKDQKFIQLSSLPSVQKNRYRIVIDPGHGGPDSGAIGLKGIRENEVVLDISLQVAQLLESKGVKVNLTRTSEIDLDLPPRVAIANRLNADAFISIHANAARPERGDVNGIETFYFSSFNGKRLSSSIQKEVLKVSPGSPDRGVRRGRFFVIRRTNMPAALVETGFITGKLDGSRLAKKEHRRNIALAIAKGILNYLKGVR